MLAVLVVLALVPTWSDGLLLKKCELKSQLQAAFSELQREKVDDIIAKLACTVEHVSGFNSSLKAITYQSDPRTLIIPPFLYGHDEEYPSGMSELPLTSGTTNSVSEDLPEKVMVTEEPLKTPNEDKLIPGRFLEKRQARKRRGAPSTDSWMSGDGSGEGSEETQASKGFDKTTLGATLEVTVEPHRLQEPAGIHYDTYKMLFGLKEKPMDNPLDGSLGTAGPPKTKTRSNPSSEDHSILYGIFQLSDIACNSGSSKSPNLCGLDCSALTDDDVTDDISCLMTLHEKVTVLTFTQECVSVKPSRYFAECG